MQAFVILKRSFRYEVKSKYLFKRKKCSMYKEVVLYNSILSLSYGKPRSNVILQKKKTHRMSCPCQRRFFLVVQVLFVQVEANQKRNKPNVSSSVKTLRRFFGVSATSVLHICLEARHAMSCQMVRQVNAITFSHCCLVNIVNRTVMYSSLSVYFHRSFENRNFYNKVC